jgi:hypothetical protein
MPVLLTYGFVLKPYVFDLAPGNSVVENLVKAGFDIYLLNFWISGHEDAGLSIEDLYWTTFTARFKRSSRPRAPRGSASSAVSGGHIVWGVYGGRRCCAVPGRDLPKVGGKLLPA